MCFCRLIICIHITAIRCVLITSISITKSQPITKKYRYHNNIWTCTSFFVPSLLWLQSVRGQMLMCLIECMIHWTPRHQDKQTLYSCHFTFSLTLKLVCWLTKNYQMSRSVFESFANWKSQSLYPSNQCFYWERSLLDNNAESINNTWEQLAELTAVGWLPIEIALIQTVT